jgi:hypothetical protein
MYLVDLGNNDIRELLSSGKTTGKPDHELFTKIHQKLKRLVSISFQ